MQPYLWRGDPDQAIVAFLYGRSPLFPEWANWTLSLPGDLDLRHPKFNAHRFLYLWAVLAAHHSQDCRFFLKADPDSFVNVPAIMNVLRHLDSEVPHYLGTVVHTRSRPLGGEEDAWESFNHGLGYVLSSGALRAAAEGLLYCVRHSARYYLDSQEDIMLGACLGTTLQLHPRHIGHVVSSFDGSLQSFARTLTQPPEPLLIHPVEPPAMRALY
ncbi:unnamed protein product, partial [Polarella glacialis]